MHSGLIRVLLEKTALPEADLGQACEFMLCLIQIVRNPPFERLANRPQLRDFDAAMKVGDDFRQPALAHSPERGQLQRRPTKA